jgi:putative sporulation protein YtaF
MHILSPLLFAISANTDNFVVGLSYGIKKIKIGLVSNLLIALISLAGTILSMSVGKIIFDFVPENASNLIGSIILILIGSWTIVKPLFKKIRSDDVLENPEKVDKDNSSSIDAKESVTLAFALTINNVGLGIGASITGLNIVITSSLTFIFSLSMIMIGYVLGSYCLSKVFSKKATIISGLIIIALGIYEMFI